MVGVMILGDLPGAGSLRPHPQRDFVLEPRALQVVRSIAGREFFPLHDLARHRVQPFRRVGAGWQSEAQPARPAAGRKYRVFLSRCAEGAGDHARRIFHRREVRRQRGEIEGVDEFAQHPELSAQGCAASAGRFRRGTGTVLGTDVEGVVEVVVESTAGEHERPRLAAVRGVLAPRESRLVVTDQLAESEVPSRRLGIGVVEIQDRNAGRHIAFPHSEAEVRNVLRDEVLSRQFRLRFRNPSCHASLPLDRYRRGNLHGIRELALFQQVGIDGIPKGVVVRPRLVLDLIENVRRAIELPHDFAGECFLSGEDAAVVQGVEFFPVGEGVVINMIGWIERTDRPTEIGVNRAEKRDLHHNAEPVRFRHEVPETGEEPWVPLVKIEFVSSARIAWRAAARPRCQKPAGLGSERVPLDAESARFFYITPDENPRVVHPVGGERFEIFSVIEVQIDHRAVVLGGGDQRGRLSPPLEVSRVFRMQAESVFRGILRL